MNAPVMYRLLKWPYANFKQNKFLLCIRASTWNKHDNIGEVKQVWECHFSLQIKSHDHSGYLLKPPLMERGKYLPQISLCASRMLTHPRVYNGA